MTTAKRLKMILFLVVVVVVVVVEGRGYNFKIVTNSSHPVHFRKFLFSYFFVVLEKVF